MADQKAPAYQHYLDLQWRLDIPIASRRSAGPQPPQFQLRLLTESEVDESGGQQATTPEGEVSTTATNEHWITADYETLLQVTRSLEDALDTHNSSIYRQLNRVVK